MNALPNLVKTEEPALIPQEIIIVNVRKTLRECFVNWVRFPST